MLQFIGLQRVGYNLATELQQSPFFFFHCHNSMCWINAIALNLQIASSSITILTILVLPIQEHGIFTICFCHPHFLSSVSYCFWSTCLLSICLLSHFSSVQFLAILMICSYPTGTVKLLDSHCWANECFVFRKTGQEFCPTVVKLRCSLERVRL